MLGVETVLKQVKDNLAGTTAIVKWFPLSYEEFVEQHHTSPAQLLWSCFQAKTNNRGSPENFIEKYVRKLADRGLLGGVSKDDLLEVCGLGEKVAALKASAAAVREVVVVPVPLMLKQGMTYRRFGDFLVFGGRDHMSPLEEYQLTLQMLSEQPEKWTDSMKKTIEATQHAPSLGILAKVCL